MILMPLTIGSYKETYLLNHEELRAVVYHERRVERLRHDRFYDLVRWGDASTVFQNFDHLGLTFGKTVRRELQ